MQKNSVNRIGDLPASLFVFRNRSQSVQPENSSDHNVYVVWKDTTMKNPEQLNRIKASFLLKGALGLHMAT